MFYGRGLKWQKTDLHLVQLGFEGEHYVMRFHTKNGFFSGAWTTPHIELHGDKANSTAVLNLERSVPP